MQGGHSRFVPALNARPAAQLDDWLAEISTELAAYRRANPQAKVAPFAVNQIVHSSNDRLERDMALCVKHRVPIVITSLRPPAELWLPCTATVASYFTT